jgi:uncharacterized protein (UPF0335 family)
MNLDKKALAGFIREIEDSRERQKAETVFQRDVFGRAREKHFDVKAMRIVLQRRAMEPGKRDEQDYNVHAYELALGAKKDAVEAMEQGASAREAAEKYDLPRAAVTALKPDMKNANIDPPVEQGDRQSPLRDGGAPVATSTVGPAVTTHEIPWEITGGSMEPLTDEDKRRLKIERDALDIPSFLRRTA